MYNDKGQQKSSLTASSPQMPAATLNAHAPSQHHDPHSSHLQQHNQSHFSHVTHHFHHHALHHSQPATHHMQPLQHTHYQFQRMQQPHHHNLQSDLKFQEPHVPQQHLSKSHHGTTQTTHQQQQQTVLMHPGGQNQQQAQSHQAQQEVQVHQQSPSSLFTRFDANKSTKGASKLRRDLINAEIANLRDLLPLPQSTRQRLSQLQLMALVCVYVRKANYFQQVFKRQDITINQAEIPNIGFSKALSGFLMMLTQNGKLLYISDNAAEYLGHSMEDLLIHGDSVYDIIDKQDHTAIQAELNRNVPPQPGSAGSSSSCSAGAAAATSVTSPDCEKRMFLCRMNVSRNGRRQMRFGDQKVVLVQGHYLSFLPLCSRNEPVFLATCTPIAMPETRECVVQGATNVFTTIHAMDMKIIHIDKNGEFHLEYTKNELQGISWYSLLHTGNLREAQSKHKLITESEQDRSCILLLRMQRRQGDFIWVHAVLQVRDSQDTNQQPVIVCTNQVLNDREASVMFANSWIYHFYSVQSKIQLGFAFGGETSPRVPPTTPHHSHQFQPHHVFLQASATTSPLPTVKYSHQRSHAYHNVQHLAQHYQNHMNSFAMESDRNVNDNSSGINCLTTLYLDHERACTDALDYSKSEESSARSAGSPPSIINECHHNDLRSNISNSSTNARYTPTRIYSTNHQRFTPPPLKKRVVGKLESLYHPYDSSPNLSPTQPEARNTYPTHVAISSGGEVLSSIVFATVVPARPRFISKPISTEPLDLIDQWNPSPPWSEHAHKTSLDSSSSSLHELSPCITTTPPTPTTAIQTQNAGTLGCNGSTPNFGTAFSFEWMSDPLVPARETTCLTCPRPEGKTTLSLQQKIDHENHHYLQQPHHLVSQHNQPYWTDAACMAALNPRQHLSQHLASHGHQHLLSLNVSSEVAKSAEMLNKKIEVVLEDDKEERESPP